MSERSRTRARLKSGKRSLIWTNLSRSKRNIAMSSIGILVGVGALVFFIGLGEGIKRVVLGKIFVVDQVEVIPPKVSMSSEMLGWGMSQLLGTETNDHAIDPTLGDSFEGIDGIVGAYPKMKFTFPAFGYGGKKYLMGRDIRGELIADGISSALVAEDLASDAGFMDREAQSECAQDSDCLIGMTCGDAKVCEPLTCQPPKKGASDPCPGDSYCASDVDQCLRPVPVIINPQLLELYNGGLAIALKLPQLDSALIEKRPKFNVILNRSAIIRKRRKHANRRFEVVGMSDKAINLGVTMPIEYVKRFNTRFTSEAAGKRYHSVILKVDDQRKFPDIVREVKARDLTLADETENALKASRILLSIEAVFTLISLVIVAIAALNISQLFFMLIAQRRREIGLLRALGASPRDITQIILGEAAVIGVIGGALGALVGWLASLGVDQLVANLPRFPYKPETLFIFPWWTAPVGIGVAVVFCIIGAYFPGREAAKQEPAEALTQ